MSRTIRSRKTSRWSRNNNKALSVIIDQEIADAKRNYPNYVYWCKYRGDVYLTLEEYIQKDVEREVDFFQKETRDGRWNETGRNKAYKHLNKKEIRKRTRMEIQKYYKEQHEDYRIFDDKDGKKFIWSVW